MDKFNLYIDKIDLNFWRELCTKEGKLRSYKKGEYFLHRGDIPKYFGFIAQGYFEYSVIDTDGNSNITGFAFCNTLVGDYYGSVKKMPSLTDVIAVKNSEVWICNNNIISALIENNNEMFRVFSEELFHEAHKRYLELYQKSPKERYMDLIQRIPSILQDITLKELASYLQITPTYLSRIRKEITFGKK